MASSTLPFNRGIAASVNAWPGDTLKFSLTKNNGILYHFVAININGTIEEAYVIQRNDRLVWSKTNGTHTTSYDADANVITVTLPNSNYWLYSVEMMQSRN